MLSSRLKAFVKPTSHRIVSMASKVSDPVQVALTPNATKIEAAMICAVSLVAGLRRMPSSTTPTRNIQEAVPITTRLDSLKTRVAATLASHTPTPPSKGVGCWCQRSAFGAATIPRSRANARTSGVNSSDSAAAATNGQTTPASSGFSGVSLGVHPIGTTSSRPSPVSGRSTLALPRRSDS